MKYRLVIACKPEATQSPAAAGERAQTPPEIETQLSALKSLAESKKCDSEVAPENVQIGADKTVSDVLSALRSVLGEDVSCTVLVPDASGKKVGDAGVVSIVVETGAGNKITVVEGKGGANEEKQQEDNEEKGMKDEKGKEKQGNKEDEEVKRTENENEKAIIAMTGSFNSTEVRNWWEKKMNDCKEVSFVGLPNTQHFPISTMNKKQENDFNVLVGLCALDFDKGKNLRVSAHADFNKGQKSNMKVNLSTWADTRMYAAGCKWLALLSRQENTGIQWGSFGTMEDHPWYKPKSLTTRSVLFNREYTEKEGAPDVAIWFTALDMRKGRPYRIRTWASNVSTKGFTINIKAAEGTTVYSAGVSWLAYPKSKKGIESGVFKMTKGLIGGKVWNEAGKLMLRDGKLERSPRNVFVAINELESREWANTRVEVKVLNASEKELKWKVETWADSVIEKAGATFVLME